MKSILENYVLSKFDRELDESEATQFCLNIFCTLDWLPEYLKDIEWNRNRISKEFSMLAIAGRIEDTDGLGLDDSYWNQKITQFLSGKIAIDEGFRKKLT